MKITQTKSSFSLLTHYIRTRRRIETIMQSKSAHIPSSGERPMHHEDTEG